MEVDVSGPGTTTPACAGTTSTFDLEILRGHPRTRGDCEEVLEGTG